MRGPATADPRRGTLSFVTQSSFVLVRSTTEGITGEVVPFCRHMKRVEHLNQQDFTPASSLYQSRLWCSRNCYKYVQLNQTWGRVATRVISTAMRFTPMSWLSMLLFSMATEQL